MRLCFVLLKSRERAVNPYIGLLFNQGHLQDPELVRSLAAKSSQDVPAAADAPQLQDSPQRVETPEAGIARHHGGEVPGCAVASTQLR